MSFADILSITDTIFLQCLYCFVRSISCEQDTEKKIKKKIKRENKGNIIVISNKK